MDGKNLDMFNFINYNKLGKEKKLLFMQFGLNRQIKTATKILSKRLFSEPDIYDLKKPFFSPEDEDIINGLISELLTMIGNRSNSRHGSSAKIQNKFFFQESERKSFPVHLLTSRWEETEYQLSPENKKTNGELRKIARYEENRKIIQNNSKNIFRGGLFSNKNFAGTKGVNKIRYGISNLNITETRAVGALYMISLAWLTIVEADLKLKSKKLNLPKLIDIFQIGFDFSVLFHDKDLMDNSDGGRKSQRKSTLSEDARRITEEILNSKPAKSVSELANIAKRKISKECIEEDGATIRVITEYMRKYKKSLHGK